MLIFRVVSLDFLLVGRMRKGLTGVGFAVFVFLLLGVFPGLVGGDVMRRSVRWPFYVLSASMFL